MSMDLQGGADREGTRQYDQNGEGVGCALTEANQIIIRKLGKSILVHTLQATINQIYS